MPIILGIDPGSYVTGYGLITASGNNVKYLSCGTIRSKTKVIAERLKFIFSQLQQVIKQYQPDEMAIEEVFIYRNANTALKLGQARGVAIVAGALANLPVAEYAARAIKQAVVGYGGAEKNQVQHMIKHLLRLDKEPQADAADALAVAMCHAHSRLTEGLLR